MYIHHGDNLIIMRQIPDESFDLIATDPPYNTGRRMSTKKATFSDIWRWTSDCEKYIQSVSYSSMKMFIQMIRDINGDAMAAYLMFLAKRLIECHRLLKPTGSIYLQCDSNASHYIKMLMDILFEKDNFRNDLIWCYTRPGARQRQYSRVHDNILFYSKSTEWVFNMDDIRQPYAKESLSRAKYGGSKSSMLDHSEGIQLNKKGKTAESWIFIPRLKGNSKEYENYPYSETS